MKRKYKTPTILVLYPVYVNGQELFQGEILML